MSADFVGLLVFLGYFVIGFLTLGFLRGLRLLDSKDDSLFFAATVGWPLAWLCLFMWVTFGIGKRIGAFFRG